MAKKNKKKIIAWVIGGIAALIGIILAFGKSLRFTNAGSANVTLPDGTQISTEVPLGGIGGLTPKLPTEITKPTAPAPLPVRVDYTPKFVINGKEVTEAEYKAAMNSTPIIAVTPTTVMAGQGKG